MDINNNELVMLQKEEVVITKEQIPKYTDVISNMNKVDKPYLPKPPAPEIVYENNGLIGLAIGVTVFIIIVVMMLNKFI